MRILAEIILKNPEQNRRNAKGCAEVRVGRFGGVHFINHRAVAMVTDFRRKRNSTIFETIHAGFEAGVVGARFLVQPFIFCA